MWCTRVSTAVMWVQPTTEGAEGVSPGMFLDEATGQAMKQIEMVVLSITEPRAKYPSDKFVRGEKPICRSRDGIVPITDDDRLTPQAVNCKVCDFSKWKNYNPKTKTGDKPTCKDSRRIYFVERTTGLPYYIDIRGTAIKQVTVLKDSLLKAAISFTNQARHKGEARNMNLWDFSVTVAADKASNGPYYRFAPRMINPMTREQADEYRVARLALWARRQDFEREQAEQAEYDQSTEFSPELAEV